MSQKEDAKKRGQMLKRLREEHEETVHSTQVLLKEQNALRKQIFQTMKDAPKTVPQIAEATGLPTTKVLWHITAMKKYDLIVETGMDGEYYLYQREKDAKK